MNSMAIRLLGDRKGRADRGQQNQVLALTRGGRPIPHIDEPLEHFLSEVSGLGPTLGPLLVQLLPSLAFEAGVSDAFFATLRSRVAGAVACEPRHRSWFTPEVDVLLDGRRIARVAADPAVVPGAGDPGRWPGLAYYRLHGSPRVYYSAYGEQAVSATAAELRTTASGGSQAWCIFDNTAASAATRNALDATDLTELARQAE